MNKPEFFIKSCDIIFSYDLLSPKANLVACQFYGKLVFTGQFDEEVS
jgi:hypothetical protein